MKRLLLIPLIMVFLAAGCNKVSTTSSSSSNVSQIQAPSDSLDLQAKCATQAEKALSDFEKEMAGNRYNSYSQQNHYNQKLNKCFVLFDYAQTSSNEIGDASNNPSGFEDFRDAYENNDLASCIFYANKPPYGDANDICFIGSGSGTFQQYSDFVNPKMEINR